MPPSWYNREFKRLRRQLRRKRHIKIELCVKLSLLRLFHVHHVLQNTRSALSLAWHEWFSCKGKERENYCCELALSSEPQKRKFQVVIWQTTSKHCTKKRAALAAPHDYFSSFNLANHWLVALSLTLPSSNLKLPNISLQKAMLATQKHQRADDSACASLNDQTPLPDRYNPNIWTTQKIAKNKTQQLLWEKCISPKDTFEGFLSSSALHFHIL